MPPTFYVSDDAGDSLVPYDGQVRFYTATAHPAFDTSACAPDGEWTVCPYDDARIVRLYSPDRGDLSVAEGGGASYTVPWRSVHKNEATTGIDADGCMILMPIKTIFISF